MVSGDTFGVVDLPLASPTLGDIVDQIVALPASWHGAGVLRPEVLHTFVDLVGNQRVAHSAETGTGKSTLLLSTCPATTKCSPRMTTVAEIAFEEYGSRRYSIEISLTSLSDRPR